MTNSVDVLLIFIALLFSALGFYWGMIRQVLAVVGLIAGIILAGRYGAVLANALAPFVQNESLASALGFVGVLLAVSAVASLLATLLRRFVGLLFLGWLDHVAGALLGFLQAALICTVLVAVGATFTDAFWSEALQMSRYAPVLLRIFGFILVLVPERFRIAADLLIGRL